MASAGTIDGGTASITDSDAWGVIGFALIGIPPTDTSVAEVGLATYEPGSQVAHAIKVRARDAAQAMASAQRQTLAEAAQDLQRLPVLNDAHVIKPGPCFLLRGRFGTRLDLHAAAPV
jgi:hypothetical protein